VNFTVNPKLMLTAGYAYINSYPYGETPLSRARLPSTGSGNRR
jgi:hypothetical protein